MTRDSSSADVTRDSFSVDIPSIRNNYLFGGFPDKMLMEDLKQLNINAIKDFLNNDTSKPFKEQKHAPLP